MKTTAVVKPHMITNTDQELWWLIVNWEFSNFNIKIGQIPCQV